MVDYTISDTNLHIEDSHRVGKFKMMGELRAIRAECPDSKVWGRCLSSLYLEWIVHNFLYMLGYKRSQTGAVDLDNPCDRPEWLYVVIGVLVWPFTFKTK